MAGAVIKGRIKVTQTKEFKASELLVGFHGLEQTYFRIDKTADDANLYLGKRPFIHYTFPVTTYPDKLSPIGN